MSDASTQKNVDIQAILNNIKQVTLSPSSLETLCEFERVLDENGFYAFLNWKDGELVSGPNISAYRIVCTFAFPLEKMPDPAAPKRLLSVGAKIYFKKAWLEYPVKITSEDDFRPTIKKPKIAKTRIWLVTINLPKYLINDIRQGSEEIMHQELETSDINNAYGDDIDLANQELEQQ
ncbi:Uncharacterised protein [uncultured archaeon]|nr:Uncharacterised protein [uncultured archaeon]